MYYGEDNVNKVNHNPKGAFPTRYCGIDALYQSGPEVLSDFVKQVSVRADRSMKYERIYVSIKRYCCTMRSFTFLFRGFSDWIPGFREKWQCFKICLTESCFTLVHNACPRGDINRPVPVHTCMIDHGLCWSTAAQAMLIFVPLDSSKFIPAMT